MKQAGTKGEGVSSGRCPVGNQQGMVVMLLLLVGSGQEDNKMATLCYLQANKDQTSYNPSASSDIGSSRAKNNSFGLNSSGSTNRI